MSWKRRLLKQKTIKMITSNHKVKKKELKKALDEIKSFHTKWSDYLKQIKLTDQPLINANKLTIEIIQKVYIEQDKFLI